MKVSLKEHFDALREADQRALQIADTARAEAIQLAREAQKSRDAEHNNLLQQWSETRNDFATKTELAAMWEKFQTAHQPVLDFINAYRGAGIQRTTTASTSRWIVGTVIASAGCVVAGLGLIAAFATAVLTALWLHSLKVF